MVCHTYLLPGENRSVQAVVKDSVSYCGTRGGEEVKFTIMNQDIVRENLIYLP